MGVHGSGMCSGYVFDFCDQLVMSVRVTLCLMWVIGCVSGLAVMNVKYVLCDWLVVTVEWAGCHESEVCLV